MIDCSAEEKKLPLIGSFFFLFVLLAQVVAATFDLHYHDAQRIAQLMLLIASAFSITLTLSYVLRWFWFSVAMLLFAAVIGGRWSVIESLHLLSLFWLGVCWARRLRAHPERLLLPLVGLAAVYAFLLCVRWFAMAHNALAFHPQEFFPGFSNQRFFGHWVTLSLPLLVLARDRHRACPTVGLMLGLLAALWIAFAIASGTRGTWLALALITLVLPFTGTAGEQLARGMVIAALWGLLTYALMFWCIPLMLSGEASLAGLSRLSEGTSLSLREVIWSEAWAGIRAHPLIGWGPMMFATSTSGVAAHPHSLFLQLAYEWGVPVALGVVWAFVWAGWRQLQRCRREHDPLRTALLASISAGLLHAQVDGLLVMPFGQTLFALLCAWLGSLDVRDVSSAPGSGIGQRAYGVRVLLIALVLTQLCLSWPELRRLQSWEEETRAASGVGIYLPRYWLQGLIPAEPQPVFMRP